MASPATARTASHAPAPAAARRRSPAAEASWAIDLGAIEEGEGSAKVSRVGLQGLGL